MLSGVRLVFGRIKGTTLDALWQPTSLRSDATFAFLNELVVVLNLAHFYNIRELAGL